MSTLALYRTLVPGHAAVTDPVVTTWLGLAVRRHNVTSWGGVYSEAMVFWAAHQVERSPSSGAGGGSGSEVGPITAQSDGDLSRSYGASASSGSASDDALRSTRYGEMYLELRDSRAATLPMVAQVGRC